MDITENRDPRPRPPGVVPWRTRTRWIGISAFLLFAASFFTAFGEAFLTLPQYGFFAIGEGSVALKLPEKAPPGGAIDPAARTGRVYTGRSWPLAPRYFVGTDPIPRNVPAASRTWYDAARIWWTADVAFFPAYSRWPIWMPAAALGVLAAGLRWIDIRRWRRLTRCPHCGYSLEGLEELEGTDSPCPECGNTVPALAHA